MTEKFVASNGMEFQVRKNGLFATRASEDEPWSVDWSFDSAFAQGLREFYLHERDAELGRWRSKEDPMWTAVIDTERDVVDFRHDGGRLGFWIRLDTRNYKGWVPELQEIAQEWIAAHPVKQPWHDAHRNELWLLDIQGGSGLKPYLVVGGTGCQDGLVFRQVIHIEGTGFDVDSPYIRSGHRIYPEVSGA